MRLGKVYLRFEYVVDLDNQEMVEDAEDALVEDVLAAVRHDEIASWLDTEELPEASEDSIPDFLYGDENE